MKQKKKFDPFKKKIICLHKHKCFLVFLKKLHFLVCVKSPISIQYNGISELIDMEKGGDLEQVIPYM